MGWAQVRGAEWAVREGDMGGDAYAPNEGLRRRERIQASAVDTRTPMFRRVPDDNEEIVCCSNRTRMNEYQYEVTSTVNRTYLRSESSPSRNIYYCLGDRLVIRVDTYTFTMSILVDNHARMTILPPLQMISFEVTS